MIKKKILVPIDFSDCSINALKNAINIAKKMDRELLLINAFLVPVTHVEFGGATMMGEIAHEMERNIEMQFRRLAKETPELKSVDYEYTMGHGSASDLVYAALEDHDILMVVMGTHGAKGIDEILLGSNTYSVIKSTDVPVLVIPENAGVHNFNKIALTSDYKDIDNLKIFDPLIQFADTFHAEIDVIHFSSNDKLSHEEIDMAKNIENHFKKVRHSYHVSEVSDNFEEAIEAYINEHNIDLLTMIPRKHNIFDKLFGESSWTRRMVFHSKTPLLILPT